MFKFLLTPSCPNCIDHREFFYCREQTWEYLLPWRRPKVDLTQLYLTHDYDEINPFLIPQYLNQPVVIRIGYQMV